MDFLELTVEAKCLNGTKTGIKIRDFPQIVIDTMPEFDGGDVGPCPVELMLASLASCVVETAIFLAKRARIELGGVSSEARAVLMKKGQTYTLTNVEVTLNARVLNPSDSEIAKDRLGLLEKYCIVANSLTKSIPVTVSLDLKD